jgi:hypothetical protein
MATVGQPYQGRWNVSDNGASIGVINGDCILGFVARDHDGRVLGHYPSFERAMYAVVHPADCQACQTGLTCSP